MKNDQQSIVSLLVTWTTHGPLKLRREEIEKKSLMVVPMTAAMDGVFRLESSVRHEAKRILMSDRFSNLGESFSILHDSGILAIDSRTPNSSRRLAYNTALKDHSITRPLTI